MSQWPQISLGEIFDIARGGSPRPIDNFITDAEDGVNWVSISDATESAKYINSTKKKIIKEGVSRSRMVHPGDFLLTNSMSFGRPYIMNTSGCIHDGWLVLSKRTENVDQDYFFHLLGSDTTYRKFKALAAGAVVKNLNIDLVKSVTVPLPPLEEQKRIAAILDKADSLSRKRQQAIRLADDFLRAVFLEMFGKRARNAKLGDYVDVLSGFAFKSENYIGSSGVRLLRGINVGVGSCEWTDTAFYPQALTQELGRYELREGDLVLAMDRPWISDGLKCAVINKDVAGSLLVQRVARLRAKGMDCSQFVYQCLVDAEFQRHCRVTETTIPHISPTDLATYPIPKATPNELEQFAAIAAKATALVRSGSEGSETIQSLALSLQSALLS